MTTPDDQLAYDYDRQWAAIQAKYPFVTEHQVRAGDRRIPVVALTKAG
jgi:hypothetical protein